MGGRQQRLRDPVTWALHAANHPHHSLAEIFRECQAEALSFGSAAGKAELLKIALDADNRISERLTALSACTTNAT
jgi:hypothetical protein